MHSVWPLSPFQLYYFQIPMTITVHECYGQYQAVRQELCIMYLRNSIGQLFFENEQIDEATALSHNAYFKFLLHQNVQ